MKRKSIFTYIKLLIILSALMFPLNLLALNYVAVGASDAFGVGAIPITNGYVYKIRDMLESAGKDVSLRNLGIPGATARTMQRVELPLARLSNPDLTTVLSGPNDIVRGRSINSFRSDMLKLMRGLQKAGGKTYVATSPDLTQLPKFIDKPSKWVTKSRIIAFNKVIKNAASRFGAEVVDLFPEDITDADVAGDGFHPNNEGHLRIADAFWAHISPDLGVL